jgi:AcrR family transcriptional regulator
VTLKEEPARPGIASRETITRQAPELLAPIRFATYLEASSLEQGKGKRGERSRLKLLAAGSRLLDRCNFQDLKIEDVCAEAGLAKGTFYIYAGSKDEFLRALANAYCMFELQTLPRPAASLTRFGRSRLWIHWYERTFASNVGILRCMVQMGASDAKMSALWRQRNGDLVHAMLADTVNLDSLVTDDRNIVLWTLRTIGGMLDQSLFDRYGVQTPSGMEDPADMDLIVELHAVFAYRALYGQDPPAEEVHQAGVLTRLNTIFKI